MSEPTVVVDGSGLLATALDQQLDELFPAAAATAAERADVVVTVADGY